MNALKSSTGQKKIRLQRRKENLCMHRKIQPSNMRFYQCSRSVPEGGQRLLGVKILHMEECLLSPSLKNSNRRHKEQVTKPGKKKKKIKGPKLLYESVQCQFRSHSCYIGKPLTIPNTKKNVNSERSDYLFTLSIV